jgi:hypothetical protein
LVDGLAVPIPTDPLKYPDVAETDPPLKLVALVAAPTVKLDAVPVRPVPGPENCVEARTVPVTSRVTPGLVVPIPTDPMPTSLLLL